MRILAHRAGVALFWVGQASPVVGLITEEGLTRALFSFPQESQWSPRGAATRHAHI